MTIPIDKISADSGFGTSVYRKRDKSVRGGCLRRLRSGCWGASFFRATNQTHTDDHPSEYCTY
jgi:hypothetical protein